MVKNIPDGVYPTMVTPFTEDNKVDYNGVLELLNWYSEKGVDGIFAICQSSEIFFLSFEERLELLKFIMKNLPKGMSVVASGHTVDDLDRQIYEANAFIDEGIDAYVFIANRFAAQDEDDSIFLRNFDKAVSSIPEIGLGIYECPYPYKRLMKPETLRECALGGRLKFLKDTCCRIGEIKAKLEAVDASASKYITPTPPRSLNHSRRAAPAIRALWATSTPRYIHGSAKTTKPSPRRQSWCRLFLRLLRSQSARCTPSMRNIISVSAVLISATAQGQRMRQCSARAIKKRSSKC